MKNREIVKYVKKIGKMEIKVLGPGCSKCRETYRLVEKIIRESNVDAHLEKVEDIVEIMTYNVLASPAVVIDGAVKVRGRVPSEAEIRKLLGIG